MKTQSAKAKGRKLQQFISATVVNAFPVLETDDVVSRPMGSGGVDIMMSPKAQKVFPVSIESKNTKVKPAGKARDQAGSNAYEGTVPAVAWKPPGKGMDDTVVMLKLHDLIELVKIVRGEHGEK